MLTDDIELSIAGQYAGAMGTEQAGDSLMVRLPSAVREDSVEPAKCRCDLVMLPGLHCGGLIDNLSF